jgi:hypothetical protein
MVTDLTARVFEDLHAARVLHESASIQLNAVEKRVEKPSAERLKAEAGAIVTQCRFDCRLLECAIRESALSWGSSDGTLISLAERSTVELEASLAALRVEPVAVATLALDERAMEHDAVLRLHDFANFRRLFEHREAVLAATMRVASAFLAQSTGRAADTLEPPRSVPQTASNRVKSPGIEACMRVLRECRRLAGSDAQVKAPRAAAVHSPPRQRDRLPPAEGASQQSGGARPSSSSSRRAGSAAAASAGDGGELGDADYRVYVEHSVAELSDARLRAQLAAALVKQRAYVREQRNQFLQYAELEAERNSLRERVAQQAKEIAAFLATRRRLFGDAQQRFAPAVKGLGSLSRKSLAVAKHVDGVHRQVETIGAECDALRAELAHEKRARASVEAERDTFASKIAVVLKTSARFRTEATRQQRIVEIATAAHAKQRDLLQRNGVENGELRRELMGVVLEQRERDAAADAAAHELARLREERERSRDRATRAESEQEDAAQRADVLAAELEKLKSDVLRRVAEAKLAGIEKDWRREYTSVKAEHKELRALVSELQEANAALEERLRDVVGSMSSDADDDYGEGEEEEEGAEDGAAVKDGGAVSARPRSPAEYGEAMGAAAEAR